MITPIKSIFASETSNKLNLTDSQIANGIQYQGSVVSNQLNAIANRTDNMIDDLQRSVAFYNNQKQYRKNNLCKLLVKYNGDYGIVTLIWKNAKEGNSAPFIEKEGITTLNFNYDYTSNVPMLSVDTDNIFDFILAKLLNDKYWEIVSIGDNFKQKEINTFSVIFKQDFNTSYKFRGVYNLRLNFSLTECDAICIYSVQADKDFSSPFFTKEFLYSIYKNKLQYCFAETAVYVGNGGWYEAFISLGAFDNWDLKKNKISLFYTWGAMSFSVIGIKFNS